jgi:tagatose 1,6-diphosphate aldolase
MTTPIWPLSRWGKHWGLRRLADADGCFSMVAIDQRPPIVELIARARAVPPGAVGFDDIVQVKALLAEGLAAHASALLVDPNFGLPAATPWLDPRRGLVITLEEHRYEDRPEGRRSGLIPRWSVAEIRRLGADAVKLLAWYRPDASEAVRLHQQALVRSVGDACRQQDIAFVFELLVHPFAAGPAGAAEYREDPAKQASRVIDSVRAFADPAYGVDLFKLESPLPTGQLPDPEAREGAAAQALFDELGAACRGTPWVMLSAGASMASFERAITFACRAGACGFLAGRAVWWDALSAFPDGDTVRARLRDSAVPYLQRLREQVARIGQPWRASIDFGLVRSEGDICSERSASGAMDVAARG